MGEHTDGRDADTAPGRLRGVVATAHRGLTEQERGQYIDVYLGFEGAVYDRSHTPEHRLLGHPYNLEGDARADSMLSARQQARAEDAAPAPDEAELERAAEDWVLLLQLDTTSRWVWTGMEAA